MAHDVGVSHVQRALRTRVMRFEAGGGPAAFSTAIDTRMGAQTGTFDELALTLSGLSFYQRLSAYERAPAAMSMAVWDEKGIVVGASIGPSAPPPAPLTADVGLRIRSPFAAPRQGGWFTFWGGRNLA